MRPEPQPAKTVLLNSINRVKSIGQVHTMLSEDSFGAVDFQSIAEAIVGFVTASWGSGRSVEVEVERRSCGPRPEASKLPGLGRQ